VTPVYYHGYTRGLYTCVSAITGKLCNRGGLTAMKETAGNADDVHNYNSTPVNISLRDLSRSGISLRHQQ